MKSFSQTMMENGTPNSSAPSESNRRPTLQTLAGLLAASATALLFSGCAATQVTLEHKSLDVQTRMSQTVFLDAERPAERTVLLDIKNTSDKPVEVAGLIRQRLEAKGYRIVNSPNDAYYILQVNVRQVAKRSPSALHESQYSPSDSAAAGSAVGSMLSGGLESLDGFGYGAAIGGVAAGVADFVASALVHNVTYRMITDLQILERTDEKVSQTVNSDLQQGTGTRVLQTSQSTRDRRKYQTQIVSTANKVNLKFDKALQLLEDNLAQSIAGIM